MASPLKLLREAGLVRNNLIVFAMVTAALNGIVTASVGAWLGQTYASHQTRRSSVQGIADLVYERRARGGLVVSSLRRDAELEELRHRKRQYDDVFVEWNKRIQANVLQIREVMGVRETSVFEALMQELMVPVLTEMDVCLTKAYDVRLAGQPPMPVIEACRYPVLHQFVLDCAKGFTDELYKMTRLSFFSLGHSQRDIAESSRRVADACARPPPAPRPEPTGTAAPPTAPSVPATVPSAVPAPAGAAPVAPAKDR